MNSILTAIQNALGNREQLNIAFKRICNNIKRMPELKGNDETLDRNKEPMDLMETLSFQYRAIERQNEEMAVLIKRLEEIFG
jgi:hypothetical protein